MIKISDRLLSLVKYVDEFDNIMDVGCDHALLDIYLIQTGIVNHVYVGDVNENALLNGKMNIEKYELQKNITPILSYGIEKISSLEVNTLIISGMGSKTIIEILSSPNLRKVYKLILQSNNNHGDLRRFLAKENFVIIREEIIKDGKKTYVNIVAMRSDREVSYTDKEYEFGPILIGNRNNLSYFKSLYDNYENIAIASKDDEIREKLRYLEEIINELQE